MTYQPSDSRSAKLLILLGIMLVGGGGLASLLERHRPRFSPGAWFALAAMLVTCAFWFLFGYGPSEYRGALVDKESPALLIICLAVFAGSQASLWRYLRPLSLVIAYGAVALGMQFAISVPRETRLASSSPLIHHLQVAFWFGTYAMFTARPHKLVSLGLGAVPVLMCIPMALFYANRSWIIMATLSLSVAFLYVGRKSSFDKPRRVVLRAALLGISVAGTVAVIAYLRPENIADFMEKIYRDSRSGQYVTFFQQVPLTGLITGLGPGASYAFAGSGSYRHIDNQVLCIMFRFGLPVIAGYLALVVWPSVRVLRSPVAREDKLKAIMLVFWFLTMMGLSVFAGIDYTPQSLLIIFLAGRCQTLLGSYPRQAWQPRRAGVARPHAAGRVRGEIRRESGVRI